MQPPVVRTLDQLVADTNSVYDPQRQAKQGQIATANTRLGESEGFLGQQQNKAFGDITQAAASRKALFSGFTPDQQAKYTSEKYLPALANLRAANETTIQGLNEGIMGLDSEQRKGALQTREGDLSMLYDYNKTQDERKWQTEQAKVAYERELNKLREEQRFAASQSKQQQASQPSAAQNMAAALTAKAGQDGFVHQGTYSALKSQWVSGGYGSPQQFDQAFAGYRNPKNNQYKLG